MCHGIDGGLTIRSESLLWIHLAHLVGFGRLTMVTPALQRLAMGFCLENYYQEDYENDGDNGGGGGGEADADVAAVGDGGAGVGVAEARR